MKKFFKYLSVFIGTILITVLFLTIFPSIPGNFFMFIFSSQITHEFSYDKCQLYFDGELYLYNLHMENNQSSITIKKISLLTSPISFLFKPETSISLNIKDAKFVEKDKKILKINSGIILKLKNFEPDNVYIKGDLKFKNSNLTISNNSSIQITYNFKKEKLDFKNGLSLINFKNPKFSIKIPIRDFSISGFLHEDIDLTAFFRIFEGIFSGNFKSNKNGENITFKFNNFNTEELYKLNPDIPFKLNTEIDNLSGNFLNIIDGINGTLNFSTKSGRFFNMDCTSPVHFSPLDFGEIPVKLGLIPEYSSHFNKITGSIELLQNNFLLLNMIIFSDYYKLEVRGKIFNFKSLDGKLILSLFKKTLSNNSLGLEFSDLKEGEVFNIYGEFHGDIDNIYPSWNFDINKLINGATKGLKKNIKNRINNLFNFMN